jgi:phospholipid/cholesterol/gamma-HCH transport system substrate-binding protein
MEKRKNKNALIVGVFILIAILIFVVLIFTLGGEKKSFTKKFPVKVVFTDINGLKEGNNIWFSGVRVGTVKNIHLRGASEVEVTLNIEEKVRSFIHKDATVKVSSEGLLGNKLVILYGGSPASPLIENNDYVTAQIISPNDDIMVLLKAAGKNLLDISGNINEVSKKINTGEGTLGKLINDPSALNTLQASLSNFKTVSATSKKVVDNIEGFAERMNKESSSINKILSDTLMYDSINAIISQIKEVTATAGTVSNNIKIFAENIKNASSSLQDTNNTAGMVLHSKQLVQQLQLIINNLEGASYKMDEDLEAIQHNFLFRGYFRKKEKNKAAINSPK